MRAIAITPSVLKIIEIARVTSTDFPNKTTGTT